MNKQSLLPLLLLLSTKSGIPQDFYEARPNLSGEYISESKRSELSWYGSGVTMRENWGYQLDYGEKDRYGYFYRMHRNSEGVVEVQETDWGPDLWFPSTWNAQAARVIPPAPDQGILSQGNSINGTCEYSIDYNFQAAPPNHHVPVANREFYTEIRFTADAVNKNEPNDTGPSSQRERMAKVFPGTGRNTFNPPNQTDVVWTQSWLAERVASPSPDSDSELAIVH